MCAKFMHWTNLMPSKLFTRVPGFVIQIWKKEEYLNYFHIDVNQKISGFEFAFVPRIYI